VRLENPLARVRGLGSAKEGVHHWWLSRVTSLALIPLGLWFVASVVALAGADYATFTAWLSRPFSATLMILLLVATFWHSMLGCQVAIEDYVHEEWAKMAGLLAMKALHIVLGVACVLAVLRIAL
jgi:succinate dehydrogenase / fumarate reductase membrane anchor subunit